MPKTRSGSLAVSPELPRYSSSLSFEPFYLNPLKSLVQGDTNAIITQPKKQIFYFSKGRRRDHFYTISGSLWNLICLFRIYLRFI